MYLGVTANERYTPLGFRASLLPTYSPSPTSSPSATPPSQLGENALFSALIVAVAVVAVVIAILFFRRRRARNVGEVKVPGSVST